MSKKKDFNSESSDKKKEKKSWKENKTTVIIVIFVCLNFGVQLLVPLIMMFGKALWLIALIVGIVFCCLSGSTLKKLTISKKKYGFLGSMASLIIASLILLINPVSDYIYYAGVVVSIAAIFFSIYDLIYYYNILATRKLPQFDRTGGDDRA